MTTSCLVPSSSTETDTPPVAVEALAPAPDAAAQPESPAPAPETASAPEIACAPEARPAPKPAPQDVPKSVLAAQAALMRARAKAAAQNVRTVSIGPRWPIAAAVAIAACLGAVGGATMSSRRAAADLAVAQREAEDLRSMTAIMQWKGTGAPAPGVREQQKLAADLRSLKASVDLLKAGVDRSAAGDDVRALDRKVAALRDAAEKARADAAGSASQMAAQMERVKSETGVALAQLSSQVGRFEQAQREPFAKVAAMVERLDRIERQIGPTTTASIAPAPAAVRDAAPVAPAGIPAAPPAPAPVVEAKAPAKAEGLKGWSVRGVYNGVAVLEGPGGFFEVARGDVLPGVGRIDAIEKKGKTWTVVTSRGVVGG